jgi:hypothetical protein
MNLYAMLAVAIGAAIVGYALQTAIRTFLLPQPGLSVVGWAVFRTVRPVVLALDRLPGPGGRRQAWVKLYAPLCLVLMVFATMVLISLGYALIFYGIGATSLKGAFLISLSSISTLGFAPLGDGLAVPVMATVETMTGILVVALLIGYLPTIYAAVQHRERGIAALEVKVGSPVTAGSLVRFCCRPSGKEDCDRLWADGTEWFTTLAHSHDSMAELIFVGSPRPGRSWVDTAGAVLDASSLVASALEGEDGQRADRCATTGANALRVIAAGARPGLIAHVRADGGAAPFPRAEFDAALAALENTGLPVIADRAAAWAAFAERRRAYAHIVWALAGASALRRPNHPA